MILGGLVPESIPRNNNRSPRRGSRCKGAVSLHMNSFDQKSRSASLKYCVIGYQALTILAILFLALLSWNGLRKQNERLRQVDREYFQTYQDLVAIHELLLLANGDGYKLINLAHAGDDASTIDSRLKQVDEKMKMAESKLLLLFNANESATHTNSGLTTLTNAQPIPPGSTLSNNIEKATHAAPEQVDAQVRIQEKLPEIMTALHDYNDVLMNALEIATLDVSTGAMMMLGAEDKYTTLQNATQQCMDLARNGSSQGVKSAENEYVEMLTLMMSLALLAFLAVLGVGSWLVHMISSSLRNVIRFASVVAAGNFSIHLDLKRPREMVTLAESMNQMARSMQAKADILGQVAEGNLDQEVSHVSAQDQLGISLETTLEKLNRALGEVSLASQSVDSDASELKENSHALADGATRQSAALDRVNLSMSELSQQARLSAERTQAAQQTLSRVLVATDAGKIHIRKSVDAMTAIDEGNKRIARINRVIDDIAFQTNILALNAAVEAARAGQHGKGFAVVADEVRALAVRSANAVRETTDLVESSLQTVNTGIATANESSEGFRKIAEEVAALATLMTEVSSLSQRQSDATAEMGRELQQIGDVTQENTARYEETLATVAMLSDRTRTLNQLLASFRFRKRDSSKRLEIHPD